ncbi:MAG TPA: radical SAM protein [Peptococcaceae bacterium]|nr:radical SAM protein [Peptococcaceae bacterium]
MDGNLYLNITNRCTNRCCFCVRNYAPGVAGYNLWLKKEPAVEEIIGEIGDPSLYREVVFCGYGEPLIRLDAVKEVSKWLKDKEAWVRVNTNGLANLYHNRNILPELCGIVDAVSISLNAENARKYYKICRPQFGPESYNHLLEFINESKKYIPKVKVTVVDIPQIDVEKCRRIAETMGVDFEVREYGGSRKDLEQCGC